ncbi:Ig-like domain-containing protein [Gottfriedia sp. OAE603]|uniref:Ig-like domain-containing protein n=1 Tax=Gottfriedia sp. OAE603 TaxID=2663872 RepID=UPI0017893EC5
MKNKLLMILTTFILTIGIVIPVFASTVTVDFQTDKAAYSASSTIAVTGNVLKDGQAGKGTNPLLQLLNPSGQVVEVKQWNDSEIGTNGAISTNIKLGTNIVNGTYTLRLTAGGDFKTNTITISGGVTQTGSVTIGFDKPEYSPNGLVRIDGNVLVDNKPANKTVSIKVEKGSSVILPPTNVTSPGGVFTKSFTIPANASPGTYTVTASIVGMSAIDSKTFVVKAAPTTPTDPGTPPPGPVVPPTDPEPPATGLEAPKVDAVTSESTVISGKAKAGTTVSVTDKKEFNATTTADASGAFSIKLSKKIKEGTVLYVKATDSKGEASKEVAIVVADKTAPKAPTVSALKDYDKVITGKAEAGSIITIKAGTKVIKTGTADKNGNFKISIPAQKANTILFITSKDKDGNVSTVTKVKVLDKTAPGAPTVIKVKASSKTVTGKAEAGATVYVKVGKKVIGSAVVNSKGSYTVKINNQKAGTTLVVYVKDKAGNVGKTKSIKVSK